MKKNITLFIAVFAAAFAVARDNGKNKPQIPRNYRAQTSTAAKGTNTAERLIAYSYRLKRNPSVVQDTTHYFYSGSRGSLPIDRNISLTPVISIVNGQNIKCDTFFAKVNGYIAGSYAYNVQNKAEEHKTYDTSGSGTGTLMPTTHSFYTYNASGNMINDSLHYASGTTYENYYVYDGSGHLVEDSVYNFSTSMPYEKSIYTNDAHGNELTETVYTWSGSWQPYYMYTSTYDINNNLLTTIGQNYSGSWINATKDSFYYSGSSNKYTYSVHSNWTGSWSPITANSYHVNTANLWDTVVYYEWGTSSFVTYEKEYDTYDAYGNLQYSGGILYNGTTNTFEDTSYDINTFYYEIYNDAGVNNTHGTPASVSVYPNPAQNILIIATQNIVIGQRVEITLTNMHGQCMYKASTSGSGKYKVGMAAYPPGIYIVSIICNGQYYTEKVIKSE